MRFASKTKSKAPVLSLTSMLDVIFLLLFYFAAMSIRTQWESDVNVDLPKAATSEKATDVLAEILNIRKDGTMTWGAEEVKDLADLQAKLQALAGPNGEGAGQPVVIRADKGVVYEKVLEVIDLCRETGFWNFSLRTSGEGTEPPQETPAS